MWMMRMNSRRRRRRSADFDVLPPLQVHIAAWETNDMLGKILLTVNKFDETDAFNIVRQCHGIFEGLLINYFRDNVEKVKQDDPTGSVYGIKPIECPKMLGPIISEIEKKLPHLATKDCLAIWREKVTWRNFYSHEDGTDHTPHKKFASKWINFLARDVFPIVCDTKTNGRSAELYKELMDRIDEGLVRSS